MKKFLFDTNDFEKTAPEEPPAPTFSEADLEAARIEAYNRGKSEGIRETRETQEEVNNALLAKLGTLTEQLAAAEERRHIFAMSEAARIALRIVAKIMPAFAERFGVLEVERAILSTIEARKDEKRFDVSVSPHDLLAIQAQITALCDSKGYTGAIYVKADDTLKRGDCRIEWAQGGLEKINDILAARIESECLKAIDGLEKTTASDT